MLGSRRARIHYLTLFTYFSVTVNKIYVELCGTDWKLHLLSLESFPLLPDKTFHTSRDSVY